MGSSPRVRGKRARRNHHRRRIGLIPACAGKTSQGGKPIRTQRAHPRVCGENQFACSTPMEDEGSSPRVRGKPGLDALNGR